MILKRDKKDRVVREIEPKTKTGEEKIFWRRMKEQGKLTNSEKDQKNTFSA